MKFKIGQKVRVKQWVGMPQDIMGRWGLNTHIGEVGFITQKNPYSGDDNGYDIKIKNKKDSFFCLEQELEPFIKVGEQLLFNFIKE